MNGLLLDTHVFLWAVADPGRLDPAVRRAVEDAATSVLVSAASIWEIAIKRALGRLAFPMNRLDEMMREKGFSALPVTHAHAAAAGALPRHHADPFDRMLVAQAQLERLALASADAVLGQYEVHLLKA